MRVTGYLVGLNKKAKGPLAPVTPTPKLRGQ
jgi:hypothetical protein